MQIHVISVECEKPVNGSHLQHVLGLVVRAAINIAPTLIVEAHLLEGYRSTSFNGHRDDSFLHGQDIADGDSVL